MRQRVKSFEEFINMFSLPCVPLALKYQMPVFGHNGTIYHVFRKDVNLRLY